MKVIWFPVSQMQSGLRATWWEESGPQPPTWGGAAAAGTQELGCRCLQGPPAGRQAKALSTVGCEGSGAGGAFRASCTRGPGAKGEGRQKAYSTRYSKAVSHPSTNQYQPCFISEIRRDWAH